MAEKPKATKEKKLEYVTCEVCNKSMLAKTYKYSHQKLCKPEAPPPPPTPEPKPKRAAKAKAAPKTEQHIEVYQEPPKQTWDGKVSFNNVRDTPPQHSVADLYKAARDQRQQVRTRVKSLISLALRPCIPWPLCRKFFCVHSHQNFFSWAGWTLARGQNQQFDKVLGQKWNLGIKLKKN